MTEDEAMESGVWDGWKVTLDLLCEGVFCSRRGSDVGRGCINGSADRGVEGPGEDGPASGDAIAGVEGNERETLQA